MSKEQINVTKMGDIAEKKIIISCPKCKQKLRVPLFRSAKLNITCSNTNCLKKFKFNCRNYRIKQKILRIVVITAVIVLPVADIILPIYLYLNFPKTIKAKEKFYAKKITEMKNNNSLFREKLKKNHAEEIKKININELKKQAKEHYKSIWNERTDYNSKYAITQREKSQLEMLMLSKDKNRSIEEIVEKIAFKAAPKNSEIRSYTTRHGVNLEVIFDMSEVTTGEKGTKTKHSSIEALKKETIRLIAKVSTDLYEFCRDLKLENMSIGLKHHVKINEGYGASYEDDIIIYQVNLNKADIKRLDHNPFLDIYAIKKYFGIQKDEFPNLVLEKMK